MAKLTKQEVEHVAKLARLDFSEEDKKKLSEQLGEILDYISSMSLIQKM